MACSAPPLSSQQMEDMSRWRIPAFGNWEFYEELPITQYFESAAAAHPHHFFAGVDVHAKPSQQLQHHHHHHHTKVRKSGQKGGRGGGGGGGVGHQHQNQNQKQKQKQSKVCDVIPKTPPPKRTKTPKAVDEDLYKIPPELLHQKPKRKRVLGSLFLGCIGINCVSSS